MTTTNSPAVELTDLVKTFKVPGSGTVRAVDGVDLRIEPGEVVAFLGPNGAGKTTTLDMVLGLTDPTSGTVRTFGQPPRRAVGAGRVSAVLQTGGLLRDLTVRETVQMIASTFEQHAGVDAVIEKAGLKDLTRRRVSKCSGGEQQRLRFALALLPDPDLLILDEPTAGMDVSARREFWDTMHADADAGRTIVFATHYLEEADSFAQRIVMIAGGSIVADGSTEEIRSRASGRTVSADLPDDSADAALERLHGIPDVHEVTTQRGRVTVRSGDSDQVARVLLTELGGHNVEISSGSLETAFLSITGRSAEETEEVPA
ncbi:ABC transporter ATP-binding protein [Ornithinicoccus hortensis]|uniref:ABC-2 type transport system ATP-binding protein n=1 Tax=Ornithinicoccus hortensis TaxID=82346 RepID=A0A542YN94_9MICO|nr:ABC transporter ATP-binding protein [Ornithinicoccus hortensis]TQL49509.1 ABC-2 type transport system ATP-binding protein [Ornithinicoccus hortensis]